MPSGTARPSAPTSDGDQRRPIGLLPPCRVRGKVGGSCCIREIGQRSARGPGPGLCAATLSPAAPRLSRLSFVGQWPALRARHTVYPGFAPPRPARDRPRTSRSLGCKAAPSPSGRRAPPFPPRTLAAACHADCLSVCPAEDRGLLVSK